MITGIEHNTEVKFSIKQRIKETGMKRILAILLAVCISGSVFSQRNFDGDLAAEMANTIMHKWPDSLTRLDGRSAGWSYDIGLYLEAISNVYARTGDQKYYDYIVKQMDRFLLPNGQIKFYKQESYNIDYVRNGKIMLYLYEKTGNQKYAVAARYLRQQLDKHPRTSEDGFWHKKVYPHQMWLDGMYMVQSIFEHFNTLFMQHEFVDIVDITFYLIDKISSEEKTGYLIHS